MTAIQERELGNFEKFCLTRTNVGFPPIITFVAELQEAPSLAQVKDAVGAALAAYPILQCCVPVLVTPKPHYARNTAIGADDVVRTVSSDVADAELVLAELEAGRVFDVRAGPLWRVALYTRAADTGARPAPAHLAVTLHHLICDGQGGRNLFGQLVAAITGAAPFPAASAPALPPALEATVDVRLALVSVVRLVWEELIRPHFPASFQPPQAWPGTSPFQPLTRDARVAAMHVPAEQVAALKAAGKARGVQTLHPLLHAAALCALNGAVRAERGTENDAAPLHFRTVTPGSLRDHARGHPGATGNYVSAHVEFRALDPHAKFWDVARAHAANLANPVSQRGAREGVGALAWVPKADEMVSADRTGREAFIAAGYASATPYPSSMELSNPGLVQETLPGVRAVLFSQTPGAGGHPLNVNLMSTRDGPLGITLTWRDGCISDALVENFQRRLAGICDAVVAGRVIEDTTVSACH